MWDKSKGCRKESIWCGRRALRGFIIKLFSSWLSNFWSQTLNDMVFDALNMWCTWYSSFLIVPARAKKVTKTGAPWAPGLQDVITAVSLEIERGVDDTSAACRQQLSCEMSWHTAPSFWPGPLQPNTRNIYVLIMRALTVWRVYTASSSKTTSEWTIALDRLRVTELKCRSWKTIDATFISALNLNG